MKRNCLCVGGALDGEWRRVSVDRPQVEIAAFDELSRCAATYGQEIVSPAAVKSHVYGVNNWVVQGADMFILISPELTPYNAFTRVLVNYRPRKIS